MERQCDIVRRIWLCKKICYFQPWLPLGNDFHLDMVSNYDIYCQTVYEVLHGPWAVIGPRVTMTSLTRTMTMLKLMITLWIGKRIILKPKIPGEPNRKEYCQYTNGSNKGSPASKNIFSNHLCLFLSYSPYSHVDILFIQEILPPCLFPVKTLVPVPYICSLEPTESLSETH